MITMDTMAVISAISSMLHFMPTTRFSVVCIFMWKMRRSVASLEARISIQRRRSGTIASWLAAVTDSISVLQATFITRFCTICRLTISMASRHTSARLLSGLAIVWGSTGGEGETRKWKRRIPIRLR
ncbi:MAG: hypothetical protein IJL44_03720 [Bacteroidales bacterium]|nr:hypothetical protein [Bacteroidales bacterium]